MTFKEFMHTPNAYLDELARKAEDQRTAAWRFVLS
mgnify:CR=1 FL=1